MSIVDERRKEDFVPYTQRGLLCSLWGLDARDMTRDELLAFIGFLNELIEMIRNGDLK